MKSRKVNYIVKVAGEVAIEDEDLESVNSALWQQLEVYSEDGELKGFGVDLWEDVVEEAAPEPLLTPTPAPLRRSNRRK